MLSHTVDYKVCSNLLEGTAKGKRFSCYSWCWNVAIPLEKETFFLTSKENITKWDWRLWYNALNHGASYFPALPSFQIYPLPFSLFCTAGDSPYRLSLPGWLLGGFRLGLAGGWKSGEEREVGVPFLLLCFDHILLEAMFHQGHSNVGRHLPQFQYPFSLK